MMFLRLFPLFFLLFASSLRAEAPWQAVDLVRIEAGRIERLLYRAETPERTREIAERLERMQNVWPVIEAAYGDSPFATFEIFSTAAGAGEGANAAYTRQLLWAELTRGAMEHALEALAAGKAVDASGWLNIRDYARASGDTAAVLAVEELRAGRLAPDEARQTVEAELLTVAATELKLALANATQNASAGQKIRLAGDLGRAEGLRRLLAANIESWLGREVGNGLAADLLAAEQGRGTINAIASARDRVSLYAPVVLPPEERARRGLLLRRFTALVWEEYRDGVRDGAVTQPMEYHEAVLFRNRAALIFGDLAPGMADPAAAKQLGAALAALDSAVAAKRDGSEVHKLVNEALAIIDASFGSSAASSGYAVAVDALPAALDELLLITASGNWAEAELKRLEAYSWFDPDIEQRLVPRAPALSLRLEARFWQGSVAAPGLGQLISTKASQEALKAEVAALKSDFAAARERIEAPLSMTGAVLQSAAIIFREGLEAVLILAALLGAMRAEGVEVERFRSPVGVGMAGALVASFALWAAARWLISISTLQREALEGGTALVAAAVLIWLTQSLFRRAGHSAALRAKIAAGVSPAGITTLAFLVVFREGFETVLFYEALLVDAPTIPVVAGLIAGGMAALAAGWVVLRTGRRLPLKVFFRVTGAMLALLSVMLVGAGIRGLQTAALVSATPVAWFPERDWLQLWFGLYPVAESLAAQAIAIALLVGLVLATVVSKACGKKGGYKMAG